ncbi:hypothetical protein GCM10009696_21290 [Kocuria himachalensis]
MDPVEFSVADAAPDLVAAEAGVMQLGETHDVGHDPLIDPTESWWVDSAVPGEKSVERARSTAMGSGDDGPAEPPMRWHFPMRIRGGVEHHWGLGAERSWNMGSRWSRGAWVWGLGAGRSWNTGTQWREERQDDRNLGVRPH